MSPTKITELTPEQIARFPEFRDKWIAIGLSTEPADRPRAEAGVIAAYAAAGLPPPKKIVWCSSPLSQGLTRAIILDKKMASVWASVGANVLASVGDSVGASVWTSVLASVWDSVWDSVWASVRANVGDSVGASTFGQHDASWLAFYEYFSEVVGLRKQTGMLGCLWEIAKSAGWFLPHENICWISERHNLLARDERGRLHSVSGPAVKYPDGWAIYAVHGVRVPGDFIVDRSLLTIPRLEVEANAEVRRVMIDLYGTEKYLMDSGAEQIASDRFGTLYRKTLQNDEPIVMVKVRNSTPEPDGSVKDYFLRVPPDTRTAAAACAWTFGMGPREYAPAIET